MIVPNFWQVGGQWGGWRLGELALMPIFQTNIFPLDWGVGCKFRLCSSIQWRVVSTHPPKKNLMGLHQMCLVKFSGRGHGVWSREFISLSQELTNFFSLNLELWKFMCRSLRYYSGTKHNNVSPINLLQYRLLIGLMLLARIFNV